MRRAYPDGTAAAAGPSRCRTCGKLSSAKTTRCPRCDSRLSMRIPNSLQRTWALLIGAAVLYIPANLLPIMETEFLGRPLTNTILGGVITLWEDGSYPVALVIFIASVLVPVVKILSLSWLCVSVSTNQHRAAVGRTRLYRAMEVIGRWSMVDVFVVAILVALVRLGAIMSVIAGPAALYFCGVVVATMAAAATFDPRLIWDHRQFAPRESAQ